MKVETDSTGGRSSSAVAAPSERVVGLMDSLEIGGDRDYGGRWPLWLICMKLLEHHEAFQC